MHRLNQLKAYLKDRLTAIDSSLEISRGDIIRRDAYVEVFNVIKHRNVAMLPEEYKLKKKLSSREQQVLDLLSKGHKNSSIATCLNINEKTVSTYLARLRVKMKLPTEVNTFTLVNRAMAMGLVTVDSVFE